MKKVLIVLSSEDKITLKGGVVHATGFFFQELMIPLRSILQAGYDVEFASPKGTKPVMDNVSNSSFWFGDVDGASEDQRLAARKEFKDLKGICIELGLCREDSLVGTLTPKTLNAILHEGLDQYAGVFVPGGHAPMEDLWKDKELSRVLSYFHETKKPTALICHGPIALLSTLKDPEGYIEAHLKDDRETMVEKTKSWIYKGYALTVFTTREEIQEEPGGEDDALGGFVKFYPDEVLEKAGAYVKRADKWQNNVIQHQELITGQNPFSDKELGEVFVRALKKISK